MSEPLLPPDASHGQREACFANFYEAVHGRAPFAWQKRLAAEVLAPSGAAPAWPDVTRVPTGCGKTSVLDIAVFELAVHASRDSMRVGAARRICFVVDRKLIVDEATEHAASLRDKLVYASGRSPLLARIAEALRSLNPRPGQPEHDPLRVVRLRGGVYRDDGWAADPLTPTIIVSTVDQIGSRLLFRGYGVSKRSRVVHAGLLAFDTRIILDEAHLSTVFATTIMGREPGGEGEGQRIAGIRPYHEWAEQPVLPAHRRLRLTRMSATAGAVGAGEIAFELSKDERNEASIKPRLEVKKPAELIEVAVEAVKKMVREKQPRVAREVDRKNREKLVIKMVEHAKKAAGIQTGDAGRPIVGLVFNRVASARQAFEQLRNHLGEAAKDDVVLLTGRIRPFDRDRLLKDWLHRIKAGRSTQPQRPLFVVATQTVEVGANIDFDALVTEAAPLDALRQRFGRLHRIPGQPTNRPPAAAAVFIQSDHAKDSSTDSLYGSAVAEAWKWLIGDPDKKAAGTPKGKNARKGSSDAPPVVNFGSNAMDSKVSKLASDDLARLLAPQPDTPILFPAHLDAWAQTNPQPDPDPDVAPFLHGPASGSGDVHVVWRADLPPGNPKRWAEIVLLMPPRTREALAVPLHEVRSWLRGVPSREATDLEGVPTDEEHTSDRDWRALRWRGAGKSSVVTSDHLRAGDTIVVPASYGGADEFGWHGRGPSRKETPVSDVADQCLADLVASYPKDALYKPLVRLRLHPTVLKSLGIEESQLDRLTGLIAGAVAGTRAADADRWNSARRVVEAVRSVLPPTASSPLKDAVSRFAELERAHVSLYPNAAGLVIAADLDLTLTDVRPVADYDLEAGEADAERRTRRTAREVSLDDHTAAVQRKAVAFARACAMRDDLRSAVETAAYWHDQGKRDRRFQAWLHGSELAAFAALAEVPARILAKSARRDTATGHPSARLGYPKGHRHEFVSVRLFEQAAKVARTAGSPISESDLVRFLIGTHHGGGRAFAPVSHDHHPIQITMDFKDQSLEVSSDHAFHTLDSGWTDLFWSLIRRYGWWGLAYLEAMLITADRLVSGEEQRRALNTEAGSAPSRSNLQVPAYRTPAARPVPRTTR